MLRDMKLKAHIPDEQVLTSFNLSITNNIDELKEDKHIKMK